MRKKINLDGPDGFQQKRAWQEDATWDVLYMEQCNAVILPKMNNGASGCAGTSNSSWLRGSTTEGPRLWADDWIFQQADV